MTKRFLSYYITIALTAILSLTGCSDTLSNLLNGGDGDMAGEAVTFTSQLPVVKAATSRASVDKEFLNGYKAVSSGYKFTVSMLKEGTTSAPTTASYEVDNDQQNGQLTSTAPLYWQDNVNGYSFMAVAGSETLDTDQSTAEKWLLQDRLLGYGYEPMLNDNNEKIDKIADYNYRTSKEWYATNKLWMGGEGMLTTTDEYKHVPIFLQHQRALITVILKAGDGVKRSDVLATAAQAGKIITHIYSYDENGDKSEIAPLLGKETITYEKDVNGEAEESEVARYDAVVMPYNYMTNSETDKICSVNLASQHFSFYAGNDSRNSQSDLSDEGKAEYQKAYNLQAGDNLVITVTLSRESRKILMTAYVQPWTEVVTSYVCDDFGSTGEPTTINSQKDLEDFLDNEDKNSSGNVAILNTSALTLKNWDSSRSLNAIFNLGSNTLTVSKQLFKEITASGSIINGTLKVQQDDDDVETVVCNTNRGTVDHLTLENASETSRAVVTRAAVAVNNYGYITNVTSYVKVDGKVASGESPTYIGGIAAISHNESGSILPSISNCYVDARVGIASGQTGTVYGGGIVGAADGYVTGNTFEYGVTLSQTGGTMRNIVHTKLNNSYTLTATGNQWPTEASNTPDNGTALTNARISTLYDAVVDCENELATLINTNSSYNATNKKYRLSDSFTVLSQTWELGYKSDSRTNEKRGNVLFYLDGNNKTITLDGTATIEYKENSESTATGTFTTAPMLFCNIMGTVKDLTLNCKESLYGKPVYGETGNSGDNMSSDICAPLAYSVIGGTVENVKVHAVAKSDGTYPKIVAAIPAGLVVWACNGATIKNCTSDIDVQMKLADRFVAGSDQRLYAGGLIAEVAKATVTQCKYAPRDGYHFACYNSTIKKTGHKAFFGGIIGGTVQKKYDGGNTTEDPNVTITDCSSWYTYNTYKDESQQTQKYYTEGTVIGRSIYTSDNHNTTGVNSSECQGNWWQSGYDGVGEATGSAVGYDEKIIGKCNAVTPTKPSLED